MHVAAARLRAQAIPHCSARFYPADGHLSTFANQAPETWATLTGSGP